MGTNSNKDGKLPGPGDGHGEFLRLLKEYSVTFLTSLYLKTFIQLDTYQSLATNNIHPIFTI